MTGPRVVTLAYDGLCTFEFGVAVEVFALPRPEMGRDWYRHAVCGIEPGPLRAAGGLTVTVDGGLSLLKTPISSSFPAGDRSMRRCLKTRRRAAEGACQGGASGLPLLGCAGSCRDRPARRPPRDDTLALRRYDPGPAPCNDAAPNVLYVDEGDVLTAAGSAAGIDLCLHIIRKDYGAEAANSVARRLVVPPHRDGGQAQFIQAPVARARESARLSPLLDWVRERLQHDLSIATSPAVRA